MRGRHDGIDERDYGGPIVRRTVDPRRASSRSPAARAARRTRDLPIFRAAAATPTAGPACRSTPTATAAPARSSSSASWSTPAFRAEHISLSHVDKVVDRGYHRELLSSGAFAVYDQAFRWGDRDNGTIQLLEWVVEDGTAGQVMLGMDAARQGYYRSFGGTPGLDYLLTRVQRRARGRAASTRPPARSMFVDAPARAFAFAEVDG